MNRKKFWTVIGIFAVYCALLIVISVNNKNKQEVESTVNDNIESTVPNTEENTAEVTVSSSNYQSRLAVPVDLLSPESFSSAEIDGKAEADNPWKSNIVLLGADDDEQGLLMQPGTAIIYMVEIPDAAVASKERGNTAELHISAKLFDMMAEAGVSDGVTLVVDVLQDGDSLKTYDQIFVSGDGKASDVVLELSEWQGRTVQIRIRCYDGGKGDASGDWCVLREMDLH